MIMEKQNGASDPQLLPEFLGGRWALCAAELAPEMSHFLCAGGDWNLPASYSIRYAYAPLKKMQAVEENTTASTPWI